MRAPTTPAVLFALVLAGCAESIPDPLAPPAPAMAAVGGAPAQRRGRARTGGAAGGWA